MERWNQVLELIEEKLADEIDIACLARVALTSEYHFRRLFSALAGIPLSEYVRRRRLTLATAEIVANSTSVLDVAVRYGYGSGDAFTRAFKAMHGVTPEQARLPGAVLRSQARMKFHLTIEGTSNMRHRIVEKEAFRIVGKKARIPVQYEGDNPAIAELHAGLEEGLDDRLRELADIPELPDLLFVATNYEEGREDGSLCDYYHSVATTQAGPADLDELEVPASLWVVFEGAGQLPEALQNLWAESFSEWFPSNPYQIVPGPEILSVTELSEDWATGSGELWIPVERSS